MRTSVRSVGSAMMMIIKMPGLGVIMRILTLLHGSTIVQWLWLKAMQAHAKSSFAVIAKTNTSFCWFVYSCELRYHLLLSISSLNSNIIPWSQWPKFMTHFSLPYVCQFSPQPPITTKNSWRAHKCWIRRILKSSQMLYKKNLEELINVV